MHKYCNSMHAQIHLQPNSLVASISNRSGEGREEVLGPGSSSNRRLGENVCTKTRGRGMYN